MKKILILTLAILATTGLYAQRTTVQMQNTQARKLDVQSNAYVKPLTVELKINESLGKVADTWNLSKEQAEIALGGDLDNIRNYALYLSSKKHNADVIVAALFDVKTSATGSGYDVTVEGFPANYVNWKVADESDLEC
ncbi:MAG: hypothetical protein SNG01_06165 [Rikenellaceae bacterium]